MSEKKMFGVISPPRDLLPLIIILIIIIIIIIIIRIIIIIIIIITSRTRGIPRTFKAFWKVY